MICAGVQVNSLFSIADVHDLVKSRTVTTNTRFFTQSDFKHFEIGRELTRAKPHAILSLESGRLHVFLHDTMRVRRCLWDGDVMYDDKKEIVACMMSWLSTTDLPTDHLLVPYEDGQVFTEVMEEMQTPQ